MHNHAQLVLHILGKKTINDNTVAKIRVFVEQTLIESKITQQYGKDEAARQIEGVFRELDHALRVERTARSLYKKPQSLDATWKKRVNQVLAKRNRATTTPLRHSTSWERSNRLRQVITCDFFWKLSTRCTKVVGYCRLMKELDSPCSTILCVEKYLMRDTSQQKIKDEIKKTLGRRAC